MAITLNQLLKALVDQKGSDLHLVSNASPRLRILSKNIAVKVPPLDANEVKAMIYEIITKEQKAALKKEKSIDFAHVLPGLGLFRVNVFYQRHGLSLVMRLLPETPLTLEQLKSPNICKEACYFKSGLILVTGPTGSGKSTTLAAMLNHINENMPGHILTLEDPIEFRHKSKRCLVNQRALGLHFRNFKEALAAAVRENTTVILVGEMRDAETMALAITAAEMGSLVFSTLHTNSASKSIDRVVNSFTAENQGQIRVALAENLKLIVAQKLIPTADGKKRICLHDILVNNSNVAALIREGKTAQIGTAMLTGKAEGMQLIDREIMAAVNSGEITGRDGWEFANDKATFAKYAPDMEVKQDRGIPPGTTKKIA